MEDQTFIYLCVVIAFFMTHKFFYRLTELYRKTRFFKPKCLCKHDGNSIELENQGRSGT